ncbi:GNAT family N-acetyltransferase [Plantactinospora soyae]|uniref:GNAT superfamily N-acetyltransferase n=1 Tax=Plantactinospora soyae TaxID=1544732 RepID=A0A927MB31_9ACTN|nr:GNAT family N-acetyltransferase [Plantactinospora soyae]MBE1491302.1 GNAT superfamily N-acetyltransferase [Plantactinospora soyae]
MADGTTGAAELDRGIALVPPGSTEARHLLRCYFDEIVSRYDGRPVSPERIDTLLRDNPADDLAPPHGWFLVARLDAVAVGCAGLRLLPAYGAEVHRVFVAPAARGHGIASRLLRRLEGLARAHGVTRLRLTTRHDLVEARRLYARHGYRETPAYNEDPYVDHWFAKELR